MSMTGGMGTSTSTTTSSTNGTSTTDPGSTNDTGDTSSTGAESSSTGDEQLCNADGGNPDQDRFVVISHPYDADGGQAGAYEVLLLSADGELSRTGSTFEMGRASFGEVVFTPIGRFGLAAQDDGSVGVFELDDAGEATLDLGAGLEQIVGVIGVQP
jgi:hypothetical protein